MILLFSLTPERVPTDDSHYQSLPFADNNRQFVGSQGEMVIKLI